MLRNQGGGGQTNDYELVTWGGGGKKSAKNS